MQAGNSKLSGILVVEDTLEIREILSACLATSGFNVCSAANGLEAIHVLEKSGEQFLVLLDLMMPVMNGWQFLDAIANEKKYSDLPIVLTSTYECRINSKNIVARLPKPFDIGAILDIAQTYCARLAFPPPVLGHLLPPEVHATDTDTHASGRP
jgi:CheY-like chemotaxis protein